MMVETCSFFMESSHGSPKPDRKTVEKNRRMRMKALCSKLDSILPQSAHAKEGMTVPLPHRIDEAISYIKWLQERIDRMKERKRQLEGNSSMEDDQVGFGGTNRLLMPLKLEVHCLGSGGVNVIVMAGAGSDRAAFYDVMEALEAEGVDVVAANSAVVGCRAFHTIRTMGTGARRLEAYELSELLKNKATHVEGVRID